MKKRILLFIAAIAVVLLSACNPTAGKIRETEAEQYYLDDVDLTGDWGTVRISEYSEDEMVLSWLNVDNNKYSEFEHYELVGEDGLNAYMFRCTDNQGWYARVLLYDDVVRISIQENKGILTVWQVANIAPETVKTEN
ncbi:MAG: hypothetical protein E7647_08250 [Ruminococcaceae bacterium]|nr:hypothetical protein [Oscillospiraceae bacterium]